MDSDITGLIVCNVISACNCDETKIIFDLRLVNREFCNIVDENYNIHEIILCSLIKTHLRRMYVHPVTLQLKVTESSVAFEPFWDWIPFPQIKCVYVFSRLTGNDDTRGGGCGNVLKLPASDFRWKIKNKQGISVREYTECVYRMKGSKYDYWYELFCGFKNFEMFDNKIVFETNFDYGS